MPPIEGESDYITYRGSNFLKQRLLLSVLSGKAVKIIDIRCNDEISPGLKEYEINLIRLFDKITNGTIIEINASGTIITFTPGILYGGQLKHDCCNQRGIGYYLDVLIAIGPFCKIPLNITMKGITNSNECPSVDHIQNGALPILKRFLIVDEGLELIVVKRGLAPLGGGEIIFRCPIQKSLRCLQFINQGMVKRIRGVVYGCKVSPIIGNRIVEAAKSVLLNFLPDIYIFSDQNRGSTSGNSPGYGICLYAETTKDVRFVSEMNSHIKNDVKEPSIPEDLGQNNAKKLLEEIYRGGCCDSTYQWMIALFMTLGDKNVSKYLTGPLSTYSIYFLQHLRDFFSITFKLENPETVDEEDTIPGAKKVLLTCLGVGYSNISKRTF